MKDRETSTSHPEGGADSPPEELELRAKPAPITRINRKVLFGVVFVGLFFLAGLVIVALNPPRFTTRAPSELYNVDQKAVTDALNKLPSSYEDVKIPAYAAAGSERPCCNWTGDCESVWSRSSDRARASRTDTRRAFGKSGARVRRLLPTAIEGRTPPRRRK